MYEYLLACRCSKTGTHVYPSLLAYTSILLKVRLAFTHFQAGITDTQTHILRTHYISGMSLLGGDCRIIDCTVRHTYIEHPFSNVSKHSLNLKLSFSSARGGISPSLTIDFLFYVILGSVLPIQHSPLSHPPALVATYPWLWSWRSACVPRIRRAALLGRPTDG